MKYVFNNKKINSHYLLYYLLRFPVKIKTLIIVKD